MADGGSGSSREDSRIGELDRLVRQLESTAREAHVHLGERIAEKEGTIAARAERIAELRTDPSDARRRPRRVEQRLVALEDDEES